jgi:hypothetical protein
MVAFIGKLFGGHPKDAGEAFWQWFRAHSAELRKVTDGRESICSKLEAQMQAVHHGLTFAFGRKVDGDREFIVSADGARPIFPVVQKLVTSAPGIPGWKIIAFRPAGGWGLKFKMDGLIMAADDIWYAAQMNGEVIDLALYVDYSAVKADAKSVAQGACILLDHGLGEYIVGTRIGRIDFQPLPDDPLSSGLKPLPEITEAMHKLIR